MTDNGSGPELASTVDAVREVSHRLHQQVGELVSVLERLDGDGSGPAEVVAEQRRLLAEIEGTLHRLRELDQRETELRRG